MATIKKAANRSEANDSQSHLNSCISSTGRAKKFNLVNILLSSLTKQTKKRLRCMVIKRKNSQYGEISALTSFVGEHTHA